MNYQDQALFRESRKDETNDSLEIMCWYKDDIRQTQQFFFVNIVGGEDVTYGRLNDNFRQRSNGLGHIRLRRIDPLIGRLQKAGFLRPYML